MRDRDKTLNLAWLGGGWFLNTHHHTHHVGEIPELVLHIVEFGDRNYRMLGFLHFCVRLCTDWASKGSKIFIACYNEFLLQMEDNEVKRPCMQIWCRETL